MNGVFCVHGATSTNRLFQIVHETSHHLVAGLPIRRVDLCGVSSKQDTMAAIPETQTSLLLHGIGKRYEITENEPLPSLLDGREVLVRTETIGLNPIDWKAPYVCILTGTWDCSR